MLERFFQKKVKPKELQAYDKRAEESRLVGEKVKADGSQEKIESPWERVTANLFNRIKRKREYREFHTGANRKKKNKEKNKDDTKPPLF